MCSTVGIIKKNRQHTKKAAKPQYHQTHLLIAANFTGCLAANARIFATLIAAVAIIIGAITIVLTYRQTATWIAVVAAALIAAADFAADVAAFFCQIKTEFLCTVLD